MIVHLISNTAQWRCGGLPTPMIAYHKAPHLEESLFPPLLSPSIIPKLHFLSSLLHFFIVSATGEVFWDQKDPRNLAWGTKAHQLTTLNRRRLDFSINQPNSRGSHLRWCSLCLRVSQERAVRCAGGGQAAWRRLLATWQWVTHLPSGLAMVFSWTLKASGYNPDPTAKALLQWSLHTPCRLMSCTCCQSSKGSMAHPIGSKLLSGFEVPS